MPGHKAMYIHSQSGLWVLKKLTEVDSKACHINWKYPGTEIKEIRC